MASKLITAKRHKWHKHAMVKKERPRLQGSEKRKKSCVRHVLLHSGIYYFFVRRCRTGMWNDQTYQLHLSTKKSSQLILLLSNSVLLDNFLTKLEKLTSNRIFTESKGKPYCEKRRLIILLAHLLILVILTFPQFISVTISPTDSVTASAPSM